jgi:rhodanese-related sulfurtransferase
MKRLLAEVFLVAIAGAVIALVANAVSPQGLKLSRDYFPSGKSPTTPAGVSSNQLSGTTLTNATNEDIHIRKLREKGLQVLTTSEVSTLFRDPRTQQGQIVFVDARNRKHFEEGHIPGAYEFDHYRPEEYLPTIMPVCQTAEQIIVYCTGGDCEDSQFAAIFLRDSLGLPNEKIFVYVGGIQEWTTGKLPIETGERNSGKISTPPG